MIITVNNEEEKILVEKLLVALHDEMLDAIEEIDNRTAGVVGYYLLSNEYDFLRDGIHNASVNINSTIREMAIEACNITGTCSKCGVLTEGTIDGNMVTYQDYLNYQTVEAEESWLCESCWYGRLKEEK